MTRSHYFPLPRLGTDGYGMVTGSTGFLLANAAQFLKGRVSVIVHARQFKYPIHSLIVYGLDPMDKAAARIRSAKSDFVHDIVPQVNMPAKTGLIQVALTRMPLRMSGRVLGNEARYSCSVLSLASVRSMACSSAIWRPIAAGFSESR